LDHVQGGHEEKGCIYAVVESDSVSEFGFSNMARNFSWLIVHSSSVHLGTLFHH